MTNVYSVHILYTFMNNQDDRVKFSVKKLWRLDDMPEGSPAYQKNIIKLE